MRRRHCGRAVVSAKTAQRKLVDQLKVTEEASISAGWVNLCIFSDRKAVPPEL